MWAGTSRCGGNTNANNDIGGELVRVQKMMIMLLLQYQLLLDMVEQVYINGSIAKEKYEQVMICCDEGGK